MTRLNLFKPSTGQETSLLRFCTVAIAALLTACASTDRVVKIYENPDFDGGAFGKILVIGVSEDNGIRRRFEDSLVAAIGAENGVAVSSLTVMPADAPIEREPVVAAVRETGADAVLVTRLVNSESSMNVEGGRSAVGVQRRSELPVADFFRYEYVEYVDPMSVTTTRTVVLSTDVYNVADESKVWSVESTSFEKTSVYGLIDGSSGAISAQLARDGLLP
jgi:hypothetical protein